MNARESLVRQGGDYGVGELVGAGGAAYVLGGVLGFAVDGFEGGFDAARSGTFAKVVEHQDAAEQQGRGIGQPFAGDVRSGAVDGFKHGAVVADVAAGNNTQAADQTGGEIAHHIAIEIRQQQNIELLRIEDDLHAGVVHDHFLVFDFGIIGGDGADGAQEQAVGKFHDVGFVDGVNFFAAFALRVLKGEAGDASGSAFGDDFEAFHDAGNDLMLEAGVEIFGIFADDDHIHIFEARFETGQIAHRTKISVEVERFAECDVDTGRPAGDGCGHGAFEGNAIAADRIDGGLVEYGAAFGFAGGAFGAGVNFFPVNLDAGGFQDAANGAGDFGADAFAGEQRNFVSHRCILL